MFASWLEIVDLPQSVEIRRRYRCFGMNRLRL